MLDLQVLIIRGKSPRARSTGSQHSVDPHVRINRKIGDGETPYGTRPRDFNIHLHSAFG